MKLKGRKNRKRRVRKKEGIWMGIKVVNVFKKRKYCLIMIKSMMIGVKFE